MRKKQQKRWIDNRQAAFVLLRNQSSKAAERGKKSNKMVCEPYSALGSAKSGRPVVYSIDNTYLSLPLNEMIFEVFLSLFVFCAKPK